MVPYRLRPNRLRAMAIAAASIVVAGESTAQDATSPITPTVTTELRVSGASMLPLQSRAYRLVGESDVRVVVTAISADPRGEFLAAAGDDHVIRILSTANFSVIHKLVGHRDLIRTLAFDPGGNKLVSAGNDGQLIVWDRNADFAVQQKMTSTPALACVRFAPDGSEMAAVGFDNEIYLIGRQKRERSVLTCECNDLRSAVYRDDSGVIAVAGRSGDLHLFDFVTGTLASEHPLHEGRIHDIVFHRSSNVAICVGDDGAATVFDTGQKKLLHRIQVTSGKLFAATVLNSQLVAVAGSDNVIRVINTDEGRVVKTLAGHKGSVSTLTASDDVLFSGSFDATLRRWPIGEMGPGEERIADADTTVGR
ncbi:WD domain, G-beta repeat [Rubripirellula lacrimiformis]|uniref:WD domain, G-beta repeat n=2 Tax=Rubripirellula lacrimiformis TaxID=1930273 RepID=A0A517NER1_9BACT|nr:WD domain, G-beta repeat [Rubripirellula lacrimiformis]